MPSVLVVIQMPSRLDIIIIKRKYAITIDSYISVLLKKAASERVINRQNMYLVINYLIKSYTTALNAIYLDAVHLAILI